MSVKFTLNDAIEIRNAAAHRNYANDIATGLYMLKLSEKPYALCKDSHRKAVAAFCAAVDKLLARFPDDDCAIYNEIARVQDELTLAALPKLLRYAAVSARSRAYQARAANMMSITCA